MMAFDTEDTKEGSYPSSIDCAFLFQLTSFKYKCWFYGFN